MKTFLIFASILGVAFAGVGLLSPREEAEVFQLFQSLCSGYGSNNGQDVGWGRVYCERANGDLSETKHHQVRLPGGGSGQGQTVFIQPPAVRYLHRVQIQAGGGGGGGAGGGGGGQQTKIYVLPQQATHQVSADYRPGQNGGVARPLVYFLKGGDGGGGGGGGGIGSGSGNGGYGPPGGGNQPISNYGAPGASYGASTIVEK